MERRKIFRDNQDRRDFVERLGRVLTETTTTCLAWVQIPSHFHLLLRTGRTPIAGVMRKLLTGYAVTFNRKYKRRGHLFQNRYKSILCQEEPCFLELVRYIHSSKKQKWVQARSLVCFWAVRELGLSGTEVGKRLGIVRLAVSKAVERGANFAADHYLNIEDDRNR